MEASRRSLLPFLSLLSPSTLSLADGAPEQWSGLWPLPHDAKCYLTTLAAYPESGVSVHGRRARNIPCLSGLGRTWRLWQAKISSTAECETDS